MLRNLVWRIFSKVSIFFYDLYDLHRVRSVVEETDSVKALRDYFRGTVPCQPKDNGYVGSKWQENMNRLRELVLVQDPSNFLRWDVVRRTMSVGHAPYVKTELTYLKKRHDWKTLWESALKECSAGNPIPFPLYPRSSGNLIHQAYHLCRFKEEIKKDIENLNFIFELGGGYGGMCKLVHNLGFKGKYVIYDLAPFSALQKFYLRSLGISARTTDSPLTTTQTGVICHSDMEKLKVILDRNGGEKSNSLFIATWSISETPLSFRNLILPLLCGFDYCLIAYQDCFAGVNNIEFFKKWQNDFETDVVWHNFPIEHLPGNHYLFGSRSYTNLRNY